MQVAFVAPQDSVRIVATDGFEALAGASGGEVVLTEGSPTVTGQLDGDAAILLEMPDDLASRFARSGGNGDPRTFALPAELADRFPVLAYRMEGIPAPTAAPRRRRFPRGVVAGVAVLLAAGAGVALYLVLDDGADERTAARPAPARPEPKRSQPERPAARPGPPSRAVGTPEAGRLVNGVPVPEEGARFSTWNIPRGAAPNPRSRRYGTVSVVERVLRVVAAYGRAHPGAPRVGIADLSLRRGGPFGVEYGGTGHVGHQNGTEVDVLYPRSDGKERAPDSIGQVDRRLTQDLLDRFLAAGAERVVVDPRLGLKAQGAALENQALHGEHMHLRFPATP